MKIGQFKTGTFEKCKRLTLTFKVLEMLNIPEMDLEDS